MNCVGPFELDSVTPIPLELDFAVVTPQLLSNSSRLVRSRMATRASSVKIRNIAVIDFLPLEGRTRKEILERMAEVYVDSAHAIRCYYLVLRGGRWRQKYGTESLQDDKARSERPLSTVTHATISLCTGSGSDDLG